MINISNSASWESVTFAQDSGQNDWSRYQIVNRVVFGSQCTIYSASCTSTTAYLSSETGPITTSSNVILGISGGSAKVVTPTSVTTHALSTGIISTSSTISIEYGSDYCYDLSPDGLNFYASSGNIIYQWVLSTSNNLSTRTYVRSKSLSAGASGYTISGSTNGFSISADGQILVLGGYHLLSSSYYISGLVYRLTTPWDISTATLVNYAHLDTTGYPTATYSSPNYINVSFNGTGTILVFSYTISAPGSGYLYSYLYRAPLSTTNNLTTLGSKSNIISVSGTGNITLLYGLKVRSGNLYTMYLNSNGYYYCGYIANIETATSSSSITTILGSFVSRLTSAILSYDGSMIYTHGDQYLQTSGTGSALVPLYSFDISSYSFASAPIYATIVPTNLNTTVDMRAADSTWNNYLDGNTIVNYNITMPYLDITSQEYAGSGRYLRFKQQATDYSNVISTKINLWMVP